MAVRLSRGLLPQARARAMAPDIASSITYARPLHETRMRISNKISTKIRTPMQQLDHVSAQELVIVFASREPNCERLKA